MAKSKKTEEKQLGLSLDKLDRQSLVSLGLGALVVVVVGLLVFNYFTQIRNQPAQEVASEQKPSLPPPSPESGETPNFEFQPTDLPTTHVVQKKEHLWGLAKRYYNNGFLWVEIAKANNLKNPDIIPVGTELKIPAVKAGDNASETRESQNQVSGGKTSAVPASYTVQKGDNLCKIARRIFADCRRGWDIAKANRLPNPDLIRPGQELVIPKAV
jgi:putative chitinase